jgi:type I restriction enzyme S subunit
MSPEWRTATFAELIDQSVLVIGDGYRAKNVELRGDGPLFLRSGRVSDGRIDFSGDERLDSNREGVLRPKMGKPGDTVVTTKGNSTGVVAFVPKDAPPFVYSPHLSFWRTLDATVVSPGYLRYWSRSPEFRIQLRGLSRSTDMAPYLSLVDQRRLKITLPTIDEQRRIAGALGVHDDKIEHNRRLTRSLFLHAELLYRRGLAAGADTRKVGDMVRFHNRKRIPLSAEQRAKMKGPYPYYGATGVFDYVDRFIFDGVFVLVGEDGSVVQTDGSPVTQYVWGSFWVNNHAHVLTGHGISSELAYQALTRADVRAHVTGAVQPKLSMSQLKEVQVGIPSRIDELEISMKLIFGLVRAFTDEATTLRRIRDELLPKLVSGRIRVPDSYDPGDAVIGAFGAVVA